MSLSKAFSRRHWIPPAALIFAQLSHGFSWVLLLWIAWSGSLGAGLFGFAWIHAVALGWVTMAALAILIHALPNFVDVEWRGETLARWSLVGYGAGVALLIFGFLEQPGVLALAGTLLLVSLLVYLGTAFASLSAAMRGERVQRAVARAFSGTFVFLLLTALAGFALAWMLGGNASATWVATMPPAHANLGTLGWLTLLVFGVSMRTLRPITGGGTRFRWMHIVVGSLTLLGVPLLAAGGWANNGALAWAGGILFAIAALGYIADTLDIVRRARNPHRPPQAFVAAALFWFAVSLAIGAGVLAGQPWQSAYVFVLLMGWIGQMVNAHIYHIGIRLLSTVYRGEDDETRPQELLQPRLSWFSFAAFQIGIAAIAYALLREDPTLAARGAIFALGGWIAMIANILAARTRAKAYTPPTVIRL